MADVFERVYGQPLVRDYLRTVIATDSVSHAYLFTGLAGSNKTGAARAFAQALICPERGCGRCEDCRLLDRGRHPDLHFLSPEGARAYRVSQIRELTADCARAPIRARRKVYILDRADLLGAGAANAFLKTLEEPPDDVVLILLGRTVDSVLPTIVSRCQVVPFRHIPSSEAVGIVVQNTGTTPEKAAVAIEACGGSVTKGIGFVRSSERMSHRLRLLEIMAGLAAADDRQIIDYAAELVVGAKAPLDAVRAQQERQREDQADFLSASALRSLEEQHKNALAQSSLAYLRQTTSIIASWLRDVMMVTAGAADLIINRDARADIEAAAAATTTAQLASALQAVSKAEEAIAYNVSPETSIDVLLLDIRKALHGPRGTR